MARETRRRFHRLRDFFRVTLYWVRGHTGITGNERADILAKRGAQLSRDRRNSG
jgi:ribonuclease HI